MRRMPRILLVKTSSLGDVIHNLPVASDIARHLPGATVDWVCEAPYAELVALHPAVRRALPVHLRHLKKHLLSPAAWREFSANRRAIAAEKYDLVLDTQGLVKSAWIATFAQGPRAGYTRDSAREPMASRFYQRTYSVSRELHAVVRNRELAAQALGYAASGPADYGLKTPSNNALGLAPGSYAVFLHATSRADKQWPIDRWRALGAILATQGLSVVLPWGSQAEHAASAAIALPIRSAIVPPRMGLSEAASVLAGASLVVGVDTGLAHLAVATGTPTIGIYTATHAALTGLHGGPNAINLGGAGQPPPLEEVVSHAFRLLGVSS
jgi:heptosyltransferase I